MTARQYFGCAGLLVALFACVTQGCTAAQKRDARTAADDVSKIVAAARKAEPTICKDAEAVCKAYNDAVTSGLVKGDDLADLACSKVDGVCALAVM